MSLMCDGEVTRSINERDAASHRWVRLVELRFECESNGTDVALSLMCE